MAKKQIIFADGKVLEAREDGNLYYDGIPLTNLQVTPNTYYTTFTNSDLVGGILTITHDLVANAVAVIITDDSGNHFDPDNVLEFDSSTLKIDLSSYGTLAGTWAIRVYGSLSITGQSNGGLIAEDRYMESITVSNAQDTAGIVGMSYLARYPEKVLVYSQGVLQKNSQGDNVVSPDYHVTTDGELHINGSSGTGGLSGLISEGDELILVYEIKDPNAPIYDLFDHSTLSTKIYESVDKTGGPATLEASDWDTLVEIDDTLTIPTGLPSGFQCTVLNTQGFFSASVVKTGLTELVPAGSSIVANGLATVAIFDTDVLLLKGEVT